MYRSPMAFDVSLEYDIFRSKEYNTNQTVLGMFLRFCLENDGLHLVEMQDNNNRGASEHAPCISHSSKFWVWGISFMCPP